MILLFKNWIDIEDLAINLVCPRNYIYLPSRVGYLFKITDFHWWSKCFKWIDSKIIEFGWVSVKYKWTYKI